MTFVVISTSTGKAITQPVNKLHGNSSDSLLEANNFLSYRTRVSNIP